MTNKGVSFQPSPGGQFSAVVDSQRSSGTALRGSRGRQSPYLVHRGEDVAVLRDLGDAPLRDPDQIPSEELDVAPEPVTPANSPSCVPS
jgi:hypothetical protein